ncbi:MAG: hypothetical protein ABIH42_00520 [Planctomycetota bacterium]
MTEPEENKDKPQDESQTATQTDQKKESEVKEERISKWPILPLIVIPIGFLILLCQLVSTPVPKAEPPDPSAGVNEEQLLKKADFLTNEARKFYQLAATEENHEKKKELCSNARNKCYEALDIYNKIAEAYQQQGLEGQATYLWEKSNEELNILIRDINFISPMK